MEKRIYYYPKKQGVIKVRPRANRIIKDFYLNNSGSAVIKYAEKGVKGYVKKPEIRIISPPKNKKIIGITKLKNNGFNISYGLFERKKQKLVRKTRRKY